MTPPQFSLREDARIWPISPDLQVKNSFCRVGGFESYFLSDESFIFDGGLFLGYLQDLQIKGWGNIFSLG
ncbi:hypothetical protein HW115_02395 [Verrucomicrobiaceae bacterium N1E253]|uniref:Uncharacterized protein n=1 Tax=Oceaniferula marina TaxID=2748318 RepID=A0A851GJV0_9BACT|nr:hypothetical protein [Oceaniferula marina]